MRSHVLIALLALVLLMGIAMQSELQKSGSLIQRIETADIAIEHTAPLSMQFRMSTRNDQAIAEFLPTGSGVALVSVPMNWQRSEVRGTPLKQLENEEPVFGYARWKIPSGTQITFSIMDAPQKVLLHNPTGVRLKLQTTFVDLDTDIVEHDIVLLEEKRILLTIPCSSCH